MRDADLSQYSPELVHIPGFQLCEPLFREFDAMSDGHTNTEYLLAWLLEDGTQNLPDTLAPGETLSGAVLAKNAAQLRKGFELRLLGPPAVGAAEFGWGAGAGARTGEQGTAVDPGAGAWRSHQSREHR